MSFTSLAARASMRCFRAKVATYSSTFEYNGLNAFFVSTLGGSKYPTMEDKYMLKNRPQGLLQLANSALGWSYLHPAETLQFSRFKWHKMLLGTSFALATGIALVKGIFSGAECESKMAGNESYGNTSLHERDSRVNTRKNKDCYILSFDGGGSKGVIEIVMLKRVFDYLTLLQQRPETTNWIFAKGSIDADSMIKKFSDAEYDRITPIESYQHCKGCFVKDEAESSFVMSVKTFSDKLKIMESKITGIDIKDFASFWMNYWFVIDKSEKLKLEKQLRNLGKERLGGLGIQDIQITDLNKEQLLVMIDFDTDSSIEKREEVLREIKETEDHLKTSDFVSLVHPTDIFDIIVGTSTGSLISFGLVGGNRQRDEVIEERLPMSLEQCLEMYKKNVAIIFSRNWFHGALTLIQKIIGKLMLFLWPYRMKNLQTVLEDQFGKDTTLSQIPSDKCIAAAVARKVSGEEDKLVLFDTILNEVKYTSVVSALLASSNAPIYFDTPVKIFGHSYVDGGVGGNCPLKQVFPLAKEVFRSIEFALSVAPPTKQKKVPKTAVEWIQYFVHLTTDGTLEYYTFKNTLESSEKLSRLSPNRNLNRSNFQLFDEFELDSVNLNDMISVTEKWLNSGSSLAHSLLSLPMLMKRLSELPNIKYESSRPSWQKFAYSLGQYLQLNQGKLPISDIIDHHKQTLFLLKKLYGDNPPPHVANSLDNIGICLLSQGKYSEALENYQNALTMKKKLYGGNPHPDIASSLNNIGHCLDFQGKYIEALENHQNALEMRKKLYGDNPHPDIASSLNNIGNCLGSQEKYLEALENYQNALTMKKKLYGDNPHPAITSSLNNIGICLKSQGKYSEALENFQNALKMKKKLYGDNPHPDIASSLNNIGNCLGSQGKYLEALENYQNALTMRKKLYGDNPHPDIASSLNNIGSCLDFQGKYIEALENHQNALKMRKKLYGDNPHPGIASSLNNIGSCLGSQGKYIEALENHQNALTMRKKLYGDNPHPDIADSLNNIGNCLASQGKYLEALENHQNALTMRKKLYGDNPHPDIASSLNNIGNCLGSQEKYLEALENYQNALTMNKKLYGDNPHPDIACIFNNIGNCLGSQGKYLEALENHQNALKMYKKAYGDSRHSDIASCFNNIGNCLTSQGKYSEALENYQNALKMSRKLYGDNPHPDVANSLNNIGNCLQSQRKYSEALENHQNALKMRKKLYGDNPHPDIAGSFNNIGNCLQSLGKYLEALENHQNALKMYKKAYGDSRHSDIASCFNNIGICLQSQGKYSEALENHQNALEMSRKLYGDNPHPDVANSLNNIGNCLQSQRKYSEALENHQNALKMRKNLYGDDPHSDIASSFSSIGACLQSQRRYPEALENHQNALEMMKKLYGDNPHPAIASSLNNIEICLRSQGK